jgi:hypothetical protein
MPDALQVMAQGVRLGSGTDDEHIAGAHAAVEAAIDQHAVTNAAQAERDGDQTQRGSARCRLEYLPHEPGKACR